MTDEIQPVKPEIIRDEKGRFPPGVSGNPAGKPKGISITSMIKAKLAEVPPDKQKTYLEYLVDHIIKKAIADGDDKMIDRIWAYIDGQPRQRVDLGADEEIAQIEVKIVKGINDHNDQETAPEGQNGAK